MIMKRTCIFFHILLHCTMFGAHKVKAVSVMEGDSVTLNPDRDIKGIILVHWKFGDKGSTIAEIDGNEISYPEPNELFRGRLMLNQTGSLTINNMRSKHSGDYKLQIDHHRGTLKTLFTVNVYEVPSVFETYKAEIKSISVMKANPVTLHTGVTELHGDELIVWRFGDEGKLLAKEDKETKSSPIYDSDERYRHRLQLNDQTGSLTIKNTKYTDAGLYTVKISSNKQTSFKRIIVSVSDVGLSPAAVARIIVVLLLLFAAAAGFGFLCHRSKISELQKDRKEMKYVQQGESVTLMPDTDIQIDDKIQWMFGDQKRLIAKMGKGETREITYTDEGFRDRPELDKKTGSLTIKNITIKHSGDFKVKISSKRRTQIKIFCIIIKEEKVRVMEGRTAVLHSGTEIQTDDHIEWRFKTDESPIAVIKDGQKIFPCDGPGRIFRTPLSLDDETGSLTIKNIRNEHAGGYYLILKNRSTEHHEKRFIVTVTVEKVRVMEGRTAVLDSVTEIRRDDHVEWTFNYKKPPIAEVRDGQQIFPSAAHGGIFKDRLELDKTGSLTIKNIKLAHAGFFYLKIKNSSTTIQDKRFTVAVTVPRRNRVRDSATVEYQC